MPKFTLLVVDTSGIQDYIFGANNLAQNVGASYLVDCVTGAWAVEALAAERLRHNVIDLENTARAFNPALRIENGDLDAEVIYSGGGNILMLFAAEASARAFTSRLSRRALLEAPGLQLVIVRCAMDWDAQPLGSAKGVAQTLMQDLALRKANPVVSTPMLGLGVTAACAFTGLPAVGEDKDHRPVSSVARAKADAADSAHQRLVGLFRFQDYAVPRDFEQLGGSKGESSFLAVVHADGNRMGERIEAIRDLHPNPGAGNRAYIEGMRTFSVSVKQAANAAMQASVDALVAAIAADPDDEEKLKVSGIVPLSYNGDGKPCLPMRPIVYGGDDVTFVCDGRLGLTLAKTYLDAFTGMKLSDGEEAFCRAGVGVVATHFPFSRAYDLAEALCGSAKAYINGERLTALDWHFAVNGLIEELKDLRKRDYTRPWGTLNMRPVRLTNMDADWRSWATFEQAAFGFLLPPAAPGETNWTESRNKIGDLREWLRAGPDDTKHFLLSASLKLPSLPAQAAGAQATGWLGDRCAYFDAIEAREFFVEL